MPKAMISTCHNRFLVNLDDAFILRIPPIDGCRLLVINGGIAFTDKYFNTVRAAKTYFSKNFFCRVRVKAGNLNNDERESLKQTLGKIPMNGETTNIKANWTHFYPPCTDWLLERLKIAYQKTCPGWTGCTGCKQKILWSLIFQLIRQPVNRRHGRQTNRQAVNRQALNRRHGRQTTRQPINRRHGRRSTGDTVNSQPADRQPVNPARTFMRS